MIHLDNYPNDCLCVACGLYDSDVGCTCSPLDRDYACPFSDCCTTLEDFYAGRLGGELNEK